MSVDRARVAAVLAHAEVLNGRSVDDALADTGGDLSVPQRARCRAITYEACRWHLRWQAAVDLLLSKKLKPSPTPAETEVFKAIKALAPDSPEAAFFKTQLDMMKTATLQITKDTYILDFGPEHEEYEYTVAKEGANRLTVKLDSGEVHELTFDGPDRIEVLIRDSGPEELNLTFVRKN